MSNVNPSTKGGLSGMTGAIIACAVGAVIAVAAAFGITSAVTGSPAQPEDPLVVYGSASPTP